LLDIIEVEMPFGGDMWEGVADIHNATYASQNGRQEREEASLKRQWVAMITHPKPSGDPNCPEHIKRAKRINRDIQNDVGVWTIDDSEKSPEANN
ncbi:hypothetical protein BDZ91DRAFT_641659, partial [Kalaharituber pfeilii]